MIDFEGFLLRMRDKVIRFVARSKPELKLPLAAQETSMGSEKVVYLASTRMTGLPSVGWIWPVIPSGITNVLLVIAFLPDLRSMLASIWPPGAFGLAFKVVAFAPGSPLSVRKRSAVSGQRSPRETASGALMVPDRDMRLPILAASYDAGAWRSRHWVLRSTQAS